MRTLLEHLIDRIAAGQAVPVYELVAPCRFPQYSGTYAYNMLGCRCRRCYRAHAESCNPAVRARAHAESRRRHPSMRGRR